VKDFIGFLSRSARLWAVPAQMLDRNGMPPGNLVHRNPQRSRQALPFERTRSVVATDYGLHEFSIQTGSRSSVVPVSSMQRANGFIAGAILAFFSTTSSAFLSGTS